jgi:hypothetical protein
MLFTDLFATRIVSEPQKGSSLDQQGNRESDFVVAL